ncbi:uncharacterized protein LOC144701083 [Wolffia australiana]
MAISRSVRTLIVVFLLSIAARLAPISTLAAPALGLDSFLSDQFRVDPLAGNDTFPILPSSIKKSISIANFPLDSRFLLDLKISVPVRVKLVGQDFSPRSPTILQDFAHAAISAGRFQTVGFNPHDLAVSHDLHLDASIASPQLAAEISAAVRSQIDGAPSPLLRSALQPVPYSAVDAIIEKDFLKEKANSPPGFFVYLLDLGIQSRSYAYSYDFKDSSPAFTNCLGSIWTGKERYLWIDLGAGPVDYGPALSGEGVLPRGEFHPLAALHGRPKSEKTKIADLASLIFSAYKALLVPSLRIPTVFETELQVQFFHIQGSEDHPSEINWKSIKDAIREGGLLLPGQKLTFQTHPLKLSDCPICSFAIARSSNFYTSRFFFKNYTLIVSDYLDSKRLHQVLADSTDEMKISAKINDHGIGRSLPVFVFDLDSDKLLLLDRYHQAVAFSDMVIAVRTRSVQTVSDYTCNGRHIITQARNLERPIVGGVLQSLWGVSPTHLSWSAEHNTTIVDYTWSVGQTPFGPFSDSLSLSFVQRDAAKRNLLLASLNFTVSSAAEVAQSVAAHGGERKLLERGRLLEFVQRWNLFKYKLEKGVAAMSRLDYERGLFYLRSSEHDLYAVHALVHQASQEMEASLVCFKDPPFPWGKFFIGGLLVLTFFFVYSKRDGLMRSKRKQF